MARSKYDFIKDILEDKKINKGLRERVLDLASKEIDLGVNLEKRVEKIEEILFKEKIDGEKENLERQPNITNINSLPKYFNPIHLYQFLLNYNQHPVLKATCHEVDSDELDFILEKLNLTKYDFNAHYKLIISSYNQHDKDYPAPNNVKSLIRAYLTGKNFRGENKGWSSLDIKINWSSKEISDWSSLNFNSPPNSSMRYLRERKIRSFKIEPHLKSTITEGPIQSFTALVLHFKNLLHIKGGNQSLMEIITRLNVENKYQNFVDFELNQYDFSNNLELFVYVEPLLHAYVKLIDLIIEQHSAEEKPIVRLKYFAVKDKIIFSIHHVNSIYKKTIEDTLSRTGNTYSSLINKQINGLCNFRLKADFGAQKYAEINLWDGLERRVEYIPSFEGVEHILEFPKK